MDILDLYLGPGHQEVYDKREGKAEQGANGIFHLADPETWWNMKHLQIEAPVR